VSELLAIGVSHKTAPVEVRERLALTEARLESFMRDLRGVAEVHEGVAVSTCNRTELYLVVGDPVEAESAVLGMLAGQAGIRPTELATAIYSHRNCEAARHLYRVVSGLDSMIIGEAEIQGQIKRAYETALAQETAGPLSNRLFTAALATGKRVRTETAIGERQLSLPSVAVALAREQMEGAERRGPGYDIRLERPGLTDREVVIIGTGETSELAARALAESGAHTVFVATRRRDRALSLARRYGGSSVSFDELPEALERADIVVAATASPHLLLEVAELAEVMARRDGRPLLLIDLAVPRDIDAACARLEGVSLYDIDDLQAVVNRNRRVRQAEARRAEGIIEEEITSFAAWLGSLEVLPTLAALRAHAARIADQAVHENDGRWESASPRDRERVEAIARAVVNRLLHEPTLRMKDMRDDRVHARMALVRDLFGLTLPQDEAGAGEPGRGQAESRRSEDGEPARGQAESRRREDGEPALGEAAAALAEVRALPARARAGANRRP
jgi:glutamyl-tRNA reductase